jgi:phosphoglycerol transferase MdoB-like AlkP superfamily enzyme
MERALDATSRRAMRASTRRGVLLDLAPAALIVATWAKLVVASITLPTPWQPEDRYVGVATLAALLLVTWPLPFLGRVWRYVVALSLDVLLTLLTLADLVHFRFFNEVLSIPDLGRAAQLPIGFPAAVAALHARDSVLFADIAVAIAGAYLYVRAGRASGPQRRAPWRASALALGGGILLAAPVLRAIAIDREELYDYAYSRQFIVRGIGLLPYHLYDAYIQLAFAVRGRVTTSVADRARAIEYLRAFRAADGKPSPLAGIARGKNLIIVMAESLQAFPIGLSIDGQPVAPTLTQLATESLHFVNFFDQTHLGTTSDGEFTSLQSLHPLTAGAVATRYPTNDFHALPAVLAEHGYATLSAVGEPGNEWNMLQMHPKLGFKQSHFKPSFQWDFEFGMGIPDAVLLPQAAARLRTQPQPFMAFFLSLSNHAPYELPPELRQLRVGPLDGTILGQYLQSVHYFDHALGLLLDELRASGLLETSVLAVYGDHHGFLDDPAALAELLGIDAGDQRLRWRTQKRLPFLIRLPHGQMAERYEGAGGHLDIAPTLLSLLDIDPAGITRVRLYGEPRGGDATVDRARRRRHRDGRARVARAYPARALRRTVTERYNCIDPRGGGTSRPRAVAKACALCARSSLARWRKAFAHTRFPSRHMGDNIAKRSR